MISLLAKPCSLFSILFLAATFPASAQTDDPGIFYGFWETLEPAGDTYVINVKRGNRASSFYTGSAASRIIKGTWKLDGDQLTLTWDSGHRDVLARLENGTFERRAYKPGQDLSGEPSYVTRATGIDPRIPGSLGVRQDDAEWEEREGSDKEASPVETVSYDVPIRNDFNGYWKVRQGSGGFLGIGASGAEEFYLHLQRNGIAQVALRRWNEDNNLKGEWTLEGDTAVIVWPNGQRDVLRETQDGSFSLLFYQDDYEEGAKPDAVMPAASAGSAEAAHFFNAGDVRMFTMSDIRGAWVPAAAGMSPDHYVHVEGWGRASRYPAPADGSGQGEWKLYNDRVVITWSDGSKDVIRASLRGWVQESFPPGVPASGTPSDSIPVRRVRLDQLNLSAN